MIVSNIITGSLNLVGCLCVVCCVVDGGAKTTVDVGGRSSRDLATQSAAIASHSAGALEADRTVTFRETHSYTICISVE